MKMEKYESLSSTLMESGSWGLRTMLIGIDLPIRIRKMKEIFQTACNKNADKSALQYFKWLLKAVDDLFLLKFVKKNDDSGEFPYGLPYGDKEVDKAKLNARISKTNMIMSIYEKLPTSGVNQVPEYFTENESNPVDINVPVLLKTKFAMLAEISREWRETKDEKGSDRIFEFLCQIPMRFEEEEKIRLSVIRKATNSSFPTSRLTRQYLKLISPPESLDTEYSTINIAPILAIAISRNKENKNELYKELKITQHLEKCSEAAFEFIENIAKQIAIIDKPAKELRETMSPSSGVGFPPVFGEIEISYLNVNHFVILIKKSNFSNGSNLLEKNKEFFKEQFDLAKKIIAKWKKKYPRRHGKLVYIVRENDKSLIPLLSMEDNF